MRELNCTYWEVDSSIKDEFMVKYDEALHATHAPMHNG